MSNLLKRVLAGVVGIPLILAASYFGGTYFLIFAVIVSSLALWEFFSMFDRKNYHPMKNTAIIVSVLIMIGLSITSGMEIIPFIMLIAFIIIFSTIEIFRSEKRDPMNVMVVFFGYFYITIPFMLLLIMNDRTDDKINTIILIFILIWTCDTAAYFGGRAFGKHQLSEISPKKTWEGSIAGFIFTVIIALLIHFIFPDKINLTDAIVYGTIVGIFSQVGDLFESLIKRYCDVKDSSNIIPGHGGVLDRFDSLIFVAPLIFLYWLTKFDL